jgi:hypothetical protein
MSKSIYELCVQEGRENAVECYKEKCGIMRTILRTLRFGSAKETGK